MNDRSTRSTPEPLSPFDSFTVRDCPYCGGVGCHAGCGGPEQCEECDGTGKHYRAVWTTRDGMTVSMAGSGSVGPDANDRAVMEMVAKGAMSK